VELEFPTPGDYFQWADACQGYQEVVTHQIQATDVLFRERAGAIRDAVRTDVHHALATTTVGRLAGSDIAQRLERELVRSVQIQIRRAYEGIVHDALSQAAQATDQALGEKVPVSIRKLQMADRPHTLIGGLDITFQADLLVTTHKEQVEKQPQGFWDCLRSLFGVRQFETVERHALNRDYVASAADKAVQDAAAEVTENVTRYLRGLQQAVVEEMRRVAESARQAEERNARVRQQTVADCEREMAQIQGELSTVAALKVELEEAARADRIPRTR
jgi:hypothetical protein